MRFGNVALYCKGWYKHRDRSVKNMWMDLLHCINADGWSVCTKNDVATWCIHRMDDMRQDSNYPYKHQLDLSYFWNEINNIKRRDIEYYHEGIDFEDAIIYFYCDIISSLESKYFNELLVKPNKYVLPLKYAEAYYSDGKYAIDHKPTFTFSQMNCDVMADINKYFDKYAEQNIAEDNFERCEAWIHNKHWKDVVIICGTDSLIDCEEIEIPGKILCNANEIRLKDDGFLDLNIYNHCIDFNKEKTYLCRIKTIVEQNIYFSLTQYKLMSIIKEY